jgi:hopanoid biosynthesis associated protein HpnK
MDDRMFARGVRFFAVPSVRRQLEAEIRAQFSAFAQTGLLLDHVNVHKHFHLHPTLLDMLVRIGADFDLCAVRLPKEPLWFSQRYAGWLAGPARAALLRPWLAVMKHRLDAAGLIYNDQIFGIAASGAMDEATLLEILARLPSGATEIYLHPATHSGAAIAPSLDGYRHAAEFAGLLSTRVKAALDAIDARRGGYRDLHVRRERLSC